MRWLIGMALVLVVVLAFGRGIASGFVNWDDPRNIVENPHLGFTYEKLVWMFTDTSYVRRYMPIGWLSYSVDRILFSGHPASYHAGNLILHALNAVLVFLLLEGLLNRANRAYRADQTALPSTASPSIAAAAGALVWAVNPLRVEPVSWASARIYEVMALFYLTSLWCYLRAEERTGRNRSYHLALAVICFSLSLFTYPVALGGLAVYVVLDLFPLRRLPRDPRRWSGPAPRKVLLEKMWFVIPVACMAAVTLWARAKQSSVEPMPGLADFGFGARVMQAFYVWCYFLWKPWVPFDLAPKYSALLDFDPISAPFVAAAVVVGALTALALLGLRRGAAPALAALWFCHLALLAPLLGLTEHPHFTFDRYSYLQGILWAVLVAVALHHLESRPRWRAPLLVATLLWCGACTIWSRAQTDLWSDSLKLQTRMAESLGHHPSRAWHETAIGLLHLQRGNRFAAEAAFRRALDFNPRLPEPRVNLADLTTEHDPAAAIAGYREALRVAPTFVPAHVNLGVTLGMTGQLEEAALHFAEAVRLDPKHIAARQNLALTLRQLGRTEEAALHFAEAGRLSRR